ncbi:hypothetical protein PAXINDRAFT_103485 [Paxillus involutus ATCC 200175]|uniref:Cation-transporting P-type ATPase N-terminal domain-containing protein n=1 Tax=Paxillus involutus ATCC 200175 TaxID=664439 RepID=A0A0C9T466_PAXIN|nr:hypothetical protein PAXINDRAFT_103485 [Paxillus involutus ATCC 200175]
MTTTRRSLSSVVGKRGALMPMVSASANAIELSTIPEPSMVSTSAHSILPLYAGSSNPGHPQPDHRAPSPPASSYFPSVSDTQTGEPQPTPGASTHFAYSTTLRRHHAEGLLSLHAPKLSDITPGVTAEGLWQKAVSAVTGQRVQDDALEGGYSLVGGRTTPPLPHHEDKKDTASARFAHWSVEDTVSHFQSSIVTGLAASVIAALQNVHGYNEFSVSAPEPVFLKFAKTIYESPLILLLCGSAVISAVIGNVDDAVSIAVAVATVLTVGFIQEQRSEKSLEALNKLVPHHCYVIRDQRKVHILANELVPGDIVSLSTGDRVPADLRITSALDLEIDESSLTGETTARQKDHKTCKLERSNAYSVNTFGDDSGSGESVALAERSCIGYMGTLVRNGRPIHRL